jgi:hypothetical protein
MKTILVRLGFGLTLACIVGIASGCGGRPLHGMTKPAYADFDIEFKTDGTGKPTSMIITPGDGDAWLQVVKVPGPKDNRITWQSRQNFKIKFGRIDDPSEPLKPGKRLGNEKDGWNEATETGGIWEYTLKLSQGNGRTKETVGAKYSVKHVDSGLEFDPVIIVGR